MGKVCQRQSVLLNGLSCSYLDWPAPSSSTTTRTLLCLHGLGDQGLVWASLGDYLHNQSYPYRILAPDLRGHGDSAKPEKGYHFSDYEADLDALLDYLGVEELDLVAHSWGAKLACRWLTKNPTRVRRLILSDPFFIGTIPAIFKVTFPLLYRVLSFLKLSQSFATYADAEALAKTLPEFAGWSSYQQNVFQAAIAEQPNGTWTSKFVRQARDEVFEEVMSVPGLTEVLETPCLLLQPDRGVNRSELQIQPFFRYFSNLTRIKITGNHWSFLVNANEFNTQVAKFLM